MRNFLVVLTFLGLAACGGTAQPSEDSPPIPATKSTGVVQRTIEVQPPEAASPIPTVVPTSTPEYQDILNKYHPVELQMVCRETAWGFQRARMIAHPYAEIQGRLFKLSVDDRQRFCSEVVKIETSPADHIMILTTTPTPEHEVGRYKYGEFERAVVARIPVGHYPNEFLVEACVVSEDGTKPIEEVRSGLFEEGTVRWVVDGLYLLSPNGRFKYCYDVYNYRKNPLTIDKSWYPTPTPRYVGTGFLGPRDIDKLLEKETEETWEEFRRRLKVVEGQRGR